MDHEKMTSGELLRLLDGDAVSDEQRAAILAKLIDLELEKPEEEVDRLLIDECFAYLEELSNDHPKTEDELQAGLLRISFRAPMPASMRRSSRLRPMIAAAAMLLTVTLLLGAALNLAIAAKENRRQETLAHWNNHRLEMQLLFSLQGDASETPGANANGNGNVEPEDPAAGERAEVYADTASWLFAEQLPRDMLYPDILPDGTPPGNIRHTRYEDGTFRTVFSYESAGITFLVTDRDVAQYGLTSGQRRFSVGNCVFGVFQRTDGMYQANYLSGTLAYSLTSPTEQTLLLTLLCLHGTGGAE